MFKARVTKYILLIIVSLLSSACYRISYKFTIDPGKTYTNTYWNNYFIYGLAPVKDSYTVQDLCGYGSISRLDTKWAGANILSSVFSLGFTGANTLTVQCIEKGIERSIEKASAKTPEKAQGVAKTPNK